MVEDAVPDFVAASDAVPAAGPVLSWPALPLGAASVAAGAPPATAAESSAGVAALPPDPAAPDWGPVAAPVDGAVAPVAFAWAEMGAVSPALPEEEVSAGTDADDPPAAAAAVAAAAGDALPSTGKEAPPGTPE